jgi:hypothetical protein
MEILVNVVHKSIRGLKHKSLSKFGISQMFFVKVPAARMHFFAFCYCAAQALMPRL